MSMDQCAISNSIVIIVIIIVVFEGRRNSEIPNLPIGNTVQHSSIWESNKIRNVLTNSVIPRQMHFDTLTFDTCNVNLPYI